jgi:hypothetical protein
MLKVVLDSGAIAINGLVSLVGELIHQASTNDLPPQICPFVVRFYGVRELGSKLAESLYDEVINFLI